MVQFPLSLASNVRGAALEWREAMDLPHGVACGLLRARSLNQAARWRAWRVGELACLAAMMARAPAA
eukprot:16434204-Heterocapsa_arctica.AAC.1